MHATPERGDRLLAQTGRVLDTNFDVEVAFQHMDTIPCSGGMQASPERGNRLPAQTAEDLNTNVDVEEASQHKDTIPYSGGNYEYTDFLNLQDSSSFSMDDTLSLIHI